MNSAPHLVNFIATQKVRPHLKSCDITRVSISCVPVACYLGGIFLIEHWIEDGLPEQSWGKRGIPTLLDKGQLLWTCRAEKHRGFIHHHISVTPILLPI